MTATVVIVHGGMDRSSSFGRVARHLGDIPLVRYDRRGYGRAADQGPVPIEGHVDDLVAVLAGLDGPGVVVGHSMGGIIALLAAQARPDLVGALLAYEAPTPWLPWWPRPSRPAPARSADDEAEAFMRRMVGDRIWERLPASTRAARRAEGEALRADLAGLDRAGDLLDLASIDVPVISAAGSGSTWWHQRGSRELAEALPHGTYVEVPDADHGVHLSHPRAFAALIDRTRGLA